MLKVFISFRCMGLTYDEAVKRRDKIAQDYINQHKKHKDDIEIIDSLFNTYVPGESNPVEYLGKSIEKMKDADIVLVPIDYKKSRGCQIETMVANIYEIPINSYILTNDGCYFIEGFMEYYENAKSKE